MAWLPLLPVALAVVLGFAMGVRFGSWRTERRAYIEAYAAYHDRLGRELRAQRGRVHAHAAQQVAALWEVWRPHVPEHLRTQGDAQVAVWRDAAALRGQS